MPGPTFQSSSPLTLEGSISVSTVVDTGLAPTTIIQAPDNFNVEVNWEVHGTAILCMDGTFNVAARFESIGSGPDADIAAAAVSFLSGPLGATPAGDPQRIYNGLVSIPVTTGPAGQLPAGLYELVVILTYTNTAGTPGPIAGYSDSKLIQVF